MVQELEENPESHDGFNIEIGEKNVKKPKGEKLHTKRQIFKYAYGQIEKEKGLQEQNKNLMFSGVISMASDIEIRTRPPIEVCFKDLTLTLCHDPNRGPGRGILYKSDIPWAIWNPPLTRWGSLQPECAARVGVPESDTPHDT
ncbi:ABC transporter G family member 28 [Capsicum chinense]|nr:ABC transporter G family member 28 [Capsicum chinense]